MGSARLLEDGGQCVDFDQKRRESEEVREREREEGTKNNSRCDTRRYNTKLSNTHRHIKATASHAFVCRCCIETAGQNLKS